MADSKETFQKFTFAKFLIDVAEAYQHFGKSTKATRMQSKILDVLEAINGSSTLTFEDEWYLVMKEAIEAYPRNPAITSRLIPFLDAFEKAQDVPTPTGK